MGPQYNRAYLVDLEISYTTDPDELPILGITHRTHCEIALCVTAGD